MRFYTARLSVWFVIGCLCLTALEAQAPPQLSRRQRELLQGLITAVDHAGMGPASADHQWLTHVLRASDGSHYVAFSVAPPAHTLPPTPIVVYVRLATAPAAGTTASAERSIVREWLQGSRVDPRLLPQRRGVAIGDMPAMGAGAIGVRGAASVGSGDLQAMRLERERARERRDEQERRRRAALEGAGDNDSDRLPFEDFDVGVSSVLGDGTRAVQRALTAASGTYQLSVAWVDASQPSSKAQYHVARQTLTLAPAAADFGLSSIIVADGISVRQAPYDSLQQRAHPYAIGLTEITPARDARFTPSQQIAVAFQIINPAPSPSGKPDVRISPRITRMNGVREDPVATLSPLAFDANTMPPDFDVRLGHPLIAAFAAPLATIPRGEYRLVITAEDRVVSAIVTARAEFTVVGTPQSLLAEAPPLGPRFQLGALLEQPSLDEVLRRLTPPDPSPALARALRSARAGRFADLLVADEVAEPEQGTRAALSGLALLSLGNPAAVAELQRAQRLGVPPAPTDLLIGAARAMAGRDTEAVAAWSAARQAGFPPLLVNRLMAEAYLRQKDYGRAADAIGDRPADAPALRTFAATRIAVGRWNEAITALEEVLLRHPDDLECRWLLLQALYGDFVNGNSARRERSAAEARRYIEADGPHRALAGEWLHVVTSS